MDNIRQIENKLKKSKANLYLNNKYRNVDKVEDIIIDTNLPITERIYEFFRQVNNPYLIKVGNVIVEMEFSDNSNISPIACIDTALINECKNRKMSNV